MISMKASDAPAAQKAKNKHLKCTAVNINSQSNHLSRTVRN